MCIGEPVNDHVKTIVLKIIKDPIINTVIRDSSVDGRFYASVTKTLQSPVWGSISNLIHGNIWVQVRKYISGRV